MPLSKLDQLCSKRFLFLAGYLMLTFLHIGLFNLGESSHRFFYFEEMKRLGQEKLHQDYQVLLRSQISCNILHKAVDGLLELVNMELFVHHHPLIDL